MATLKQILFAVATAAVGVLASPLAADADTTATSVIGAPVSAVTQISQPLEGKELEDALAAWLYIPEGSLDITNTTLSTELTSFCEAQNNNATLTKRSGACNQGECPDFFAPFDFYEQHWVVAVNGQALNYWVYYGRWNDCGQCGRVQTSSDGCFDFTSCGRPQNICVDTGHARAHRIYKDTGGRHCYTMNLDFHGVCGSLVAGRIWHPNPEIACTW